jgi:hypothetical protein
MFSKKKNLLLSEGLKLFTAACWSPQICQTVNMYALPTDCLNNDK